LGFPTFPDTTPGIDTVCLFSKTLTITRQIEADLLPEPFGGQYKPTFGGPFNLTPRDVGEDIQAQRTAIRAAYLANTGQPASITTYFNEAWYFMPVHIALQLQKADHYQQALDWFRIVYDYTAPLADRRTFDGL